MSSKKQMIASEPEPITVPAIEAAPVITQPSQPFAVETESVTNWLGEIAHPAAGAAGAAAAPAAAPAPGTMVSDASGDEGGEHGVDITPTQPTKKPTKSKSERKRKLAADKPPAAKRSIRSTRGNPLDA
jgi:hypothetical protein